MGCKAASCIAAWKASPPINAPAAVLMAFYLAAASERGFDSQRLRGTIQNDILKEFHAQNEFVFPPQHVRANRWRFVSLPARPVRLERVFV